VRISKEKLLAGAETTGFRSELLEKAIHLLNLLERFHSHPFLEKRLALKGGTALNLFLLNLPRLSIDIDMNYIGAAKAKTMLEERAKIEEAVKAVCQREGFGVRHMPTEHAGGKWLLQYDSEVTQKGNLEVDLNFMFRVPLWPVVTLNSQPVGSYRAMGIPVIDIHELAAGKMAALLSRTTSRDLFDVHQLLMWGDLDSRRLRLAFIVYGALNRKDWRTVSLDDVGYDLAEMEDKLLPLFGKETIADIGKLNAWAKRLVDECRQALEVVLPFSKPEMEFLDNLLDHGEIKPSLLTKDKDMVERIGKQPMLEWKALHVKRHRERKPSL